MTISVVLAQLESTSEATVAGRQSSSLRNRIAKLVPVVFSKAGAQTAVALPERHYNDGNTPLKVQKVVANLGTAPAGSAFVVDVKISGTSVFAVAGDRLSIAAGSNTGQAVPTKTDLDAISVKPGQYLTVEVTAVGSGTAGSDLRVQVYLGD
jgi:hypothetical protein